jgi:hypothetical protein
MAIEHAAAQVMRKPWGVADLRPWRGIDGSTGAIGELWCPVPGRIPLFPCCKTRKTSENV